MSNTTKKAPLWAGVTMLLAFAALGASVSSEKEYDPCQGDAAARAIANTPSLRKLVALHEIERTLVENAVDLRHLERVVAGEIDANEALVVSAIERAERISALAEEQRTQFVARCRAVTG